MATEGPGYKRWLLRHGGWILVAGSLLYLFLPAWIQHAKASADPLRFHDDVRIHIWPFFHYSNPEAFQNDYLGDYALDAFMPAGFRILYTLAAWVWDPEPLSKILPYLLLAATAVAVGIAAHAFGGKIGTWTALALLFGSGLYLDRMGGGLSRAFAYPAIAACVAGLIYGRVWWAVAMVWVGAAFYPMAGVVMGAGLFVYLFLLPAKDRGPLAHWRFGRRLRLLVLTGSVAALILLPLFITQRAHGPMVTHLDVAEYPEAGPAGTVSHHDLPPYKTFFEEADFIARRVFFGDGEPWVGSMRRLVDKGKKSALEILVLLIVLGWYRLAKDDPRARRLLAFVAGVVIAHSVSRLLAPYAYTPSRYVHYGLPPALLVMVPGAFVGVLSLWRPLRAHTAVRRALLVVPSVLLLCFVGGRGSTTAGLTVHVPPDLAQIYAKIAELPPGVTIAGWPDDPMSNVPYVARRKAYMTGEMHMPHHAGHLDEVRRRLRPFFEAYLAKSKAPLLRLRDEFGVTHLLVDTNQLRGRPPGYMPPMGGWIREIARKGRGRPYELLKHIPGPAVVARVGRWVLLDLSKL